MQALKVVGWKIGSDPWKKPLARQRASQSSSVNAQISKARSNIDARQYLTALRILRSVVEDDTQNAEAFYLLGFASLKLKNYSNAEGFFARALKINANHLGALAYQGGLFLILDQPDMASTRSFGRLRLVTMKPTRRNSSPGWNSTLATTRRAFDQLFAL